MNNGGMSAGGVVAVIFIVGALVGLLAWVGYAYYNPHTPSGQFLIRVSNAIICLKFYLNDFCLTVI